jgi:hypothetical protein
VNAPEHRLAPVEIFAPWAGPEEQGLHERLRRARDVALVRARRSPQTLARTLFWVAAQLASDWVYRRTPVDDLNEVLAGLTRLFLTAGMIERLEDLDE